MREGYSTFACKTSVSAAITLVLIGGVLAQAPRQGRAPRGQVRNQGGIPLKKARPEAADPLGKAHRSGRTARARNVPFHVSAPLLRRDSTGYLVLSVEARLRRPGCDACPRNGPVTQRFRRPSAGAERARVGRASPGPRLCRPHHGPSLAGPESCAEPRLPMNGRG